MHGHISLQIGIDIRGSIVVAQNDKRKRFCEFEVSVLIMSQVFSKLFDTDDLSIIFKLEV